MAGMKVDLSGMAKNAAEALEDPNSEYREYYAFSLRELAKHVQMVRDKPELLQEFADLYTLTP